MKASYVTIQFPVPSETFATNEVRMLVRSGVSISVHGLRPARNDAAQLLRDRCVPQIAVTHNGFVASLRGVAVALRSPAQLVRTLRWIIRTNRRRRRDLIMSLALLPRAFDILAAIERDRPDIVHMYWGHYPTLVGHLVQERLPDVVTSLSIVAYDLNREYGGAVDVARRADVVRTHAMANVAHVARFAGIAPDSVNVIYNGVDVEWIEGVTDGITKVRHRVVATGRLIPEKGMDDVLTAFAAIRTRWPDASLVVAGDGPDLERLLALAASLDIAEAVQFIGHVPHARAVQEMARAEAFLLLSRYEGERLPNVVKEAMVCRCVCITAPTPGIAELVEAGVTGFVVPTSAPQEVSEILDALFSGRVDVRSITSRGREHIRCHFDLRRTAPRYEALWRAAVQARVGEAEFAPGASRGGRQPMTSRRA